MVKSNKKISCIMMMATVLMLFLALILVACNPTSIKSVKFKLFFEVDGEVTYVIDTQGTEILEMPQNPTKAGFVFDGWFWDKDVWTRPFTASSLLNTPLSADMRVYCKWVSENDLPRFAVTFETNGGTPVQSELCSVLQTSPLTEKDFNSFVAWYTDPNFNEAAKVSFPFVVRENLTLYAKWAVEFTDGIQFTLQTSTNSYVVSGYTGVENELVIPNTYNGVQVTGIMARAFEGNTMLTDVLIPDSVVSIGLGAFSECSMLKNIKMSENVQIIGANAFSNCLNLEAVELPNTLTNIGVEAFFGCTKLKELNLPNSLVSIGTNIIKGCVGLEKITIPSNVSVMSLVGEAADNILANLKEVSLAKESVAIVSQAFAGCKNLEKIYIPQTVVTIGKSAFNECTAQIVWEGSPSITTLTEESFAGYNGERLTIPSSVKTIESYAFLNCAGLKDIYIPTSVERIGEGALSGCSSLESITIPFTGASADEEDYAETSLFVYIFGRNSYVGSVAVKSERDTYYIPGSLGKVTLMGNKVTGEAFYRCNTLKEIVLCEGVTTIGRAAFYYCYNISVTLPSTLTWIGSMAFEKCKDFNIFITDLSVLFNAETEGSIRLGNQMISNVHYNNEIISEDLILPESMNELNPVTDCLLNKVSHLGYDYDSFFKSIKIMNKNIKIGSDFLKNCYVDIYYNFTMDDWVNCVDKEIGWDSGVDSYVIHCLDGDIAVGKE